MLSVGQPAGITMVAHTGAAGAATSATSTAINTTGASLLVVVAMADGGAFGGVTDSDNNTWVLLGGGTGNISIYYAYQGPGGGALVTGAGHTVTLTGTYYPSFNFSAWSGTSTTSPLDVWNAAVQSTYTGTSVQTGSITPTSPQELLLTGVHQNCGNLTPSIDSAFTAFDVGGYENDTMAYLVQGSPAAVNPTWSISASECYLWTQIVAFNGQGGGSSQVATPTFSLAGGTYNSAQSVSISTSTSGAAIRYTTDGSTPSETHGTLYSGAITVSTNLTLRAIAYESGLTDSYVASATYTIDWGITLVGHTGAAGSATSATSTGINTTGATLLVVVAMADAGAFGGVTDSNNNTWVLLGGGSGNISIYFAYQGPGGGALVTGAGHTVTLTGTYYPSFNFSAWSGTSTTSPLDVSNSAVQSTYSGTSVQTGSITPSSAQELLLTGVHQNCGNLAPSIDSTFVTFDVGGYENDTMAYLVQGSAAAVNPTWSISAPECYLWTQIAAFSVPGSGSQQVAAPTFSPAPGAYSSGQMVTISTSTPGAMIYYTMDGSMPTTSSTHYLAPFSIGANTTINAIAAAGGYANSSVTSAVYTISAPPSITSVTPTSGTAGALVTVSGTGFGSAQGTGVVWLGSSPGAVSSWSNTQITASVSQIAATGYVMVQQGGAVSNSVPFAITPSVTISGVSPASGPPGTLVTISGSGFGPAQGGSQIVLGTTNALVQSWSATQIVATVATGSLSGQAQILINGVWISGGPFAVSVPQITSVSPSIGPPGTVVTITGSGFGATQGAGTLTIGNIAGLVNSWSDTQVVAAVASSALSGLVSIQQNSYSSNAPSFIVTNGSGGAEMAKSSATNRPRPAISSGVSGMALAPYLLNLAVGDMPTIEALNLEGQPITGLAWTSSNPAVVSIASVDPTVLTAVAVGQATITAGTATASVTVSTAGGTLPIGTVLWSNPDDGSGVTSIVPAVPAATGVADVFSFQGDGTVAAITSAGITAWTADVSLAVSPVLPDFLGGLVYAAFAPGQCCAVASIMRLDGITGQVDASYTPAGVAGGAVNLWGNGQTLAVHTDGTIFAGLSSYDPNSGNNTNSLTGIDPGTGAQIFSVPLESGATPVSDLIIAGDGNAYVAYTTYDVTVLAAGGESITGHLKLLQASSAGASAVIPIQDFPLPFADNNSEGISANLITNADTGVVVTWEWGLLANPEFRSRAKPAQRPRGVRPVVMRPVVSARPKAALIQPGVDPGPGTVPQPYGIAITNGTSVTAMNGPIVAGQVSNAVPVVQNEDGSFTGVVLTGDPNNPETDMVAFDQGGNVRWVVSNDQPIIAVAGGGVIGLSGITYDQNGNALGQTRAAIQSWRNDMYQIGSVDLVALAPAVIAASFWAFQGANNSGNNAAVGSVPTTLVIERVFGQLQDCYSSVGNTQTGSFAERDISYQVNDQYRRKMNSVNIQEQLLTGSGTVCPTGTTPTSSQNYLCVGAWVPRDFADTLSANPYTGSSQFTQMFWAETQPNTPGYKPFNGQIKIDAYKPSPSSVNNLIETQFSISVNGNTGLNANGAPIRSCN